MEEDIYFGREHEESLALVTLAREELAKLERELDARGSEISRLRQDMPALPRYDSFHVSISDKGIRNPGVYSYLIKRAEEELARRQASERKKRWGEIKRTHEEACRNILGQIDTLNEAKLALIDKIHATRELLREFTRDLFEFNPLPSSLPSVSDLPCHDGSMLWRGTLLRRVAVTRQTHSVAKVEAIRGGLYDEHYDFTPHFDVALRYAQNGSGNDSISGADRTDPIVIGFRAPSNNRHIQPANEGEPGNVIVHEELLIERWVVIGSVAPLT